MMKCKNTNKVTLIHSVVWAVIILVMAYLSQHTDYVQYSFLLVVLGCAYSQMLLTKAHGQGNCRSKTQNTE